MTSKQYFDQVAPQWDQMRQSFFLWLPVGQH
jgi:hypothetical protein